MRHFGICLVCRGFLFVEFQFKSQCRGFHDFVVVVVHEVVVDAPHWNLVRAVDAWRRLGHAIFLMGFDKLNISPGKATIVLAPCLGQCVQYPFQHVVSLVC